MVDHIMIDPNRSANYPVFQDIQSGVLMNVEPPYPTTDHELVGLLFRGRIW